MGETVTTGVDRLLEYLEGKDKVAMIDAAAALNIPFDTLQAWVDFLVEEGIIGIEYKFTKPFIYLNKVDEGVNKAGQKILSFNSFKEEFLKKANEKLIPHDQALLLWRNALLEAINAQQEFFFAEAFKRNIRDVNAAWNHYKDSVILKFA